MASHHIQISQKSAGFSLIEVLCAMVIIAIAMLGAANLQLRSLKMSKGASFRNQAVLLASEIAERMEANKSAAIAGSYVVASTSTPPAANSACEVGSCTAGELANYDISQWSNRLASALPGASWQITQTTTGNPSTYQITVNWQDRREKATYDATYTGESLTTTRILSQ